LLTVKFVGRQIGVDTIQGIPVAETGGKQIVVGYRIFWCYVQPGIAGNG